MGVRGLYKFLREKGLSYVYPNINSYVRRYRKKNGRVIVAIDFWLYANKFIRSQRGNIMTGFWNQIVRFMSHRIVPVYIIDGLTPTEKLTTVMDRRKRHNRIVERLNDVNSKIDNMNTEDDTTAINNTQEEMEELVKQQERLKRRARRVTDDELRSVLELFDVMGVQYIKANYEADALCAKLSDDDLVISCLSDDMDMLTLGCKNLIKVSEGSIIEFNLDRILSNLKLDMNQFIDMCILFGCDYVKHSMKLDSDDVHRTIREHGSIENILKSDTHKQINTTNPRCYSLMKGYYVARDVFVKSKDKEDYGDIMKRLDDIGQIDVNEVVKLLEECNFFMYYSRSRSDIKKSINYINNHIKRGII